MAQPEARPGLKILALDTATEACSVALLHGPHLWTRELELQRGHSERVLGMIEEVLGEARLTLAELDGLAFGRGPGGFTGVRLAASIAQGLAFAAGLSVVPVSDLRAIAQRVLLEVEGAASVLVASDARMREVYWAWYRRGPDGSAEPLTPEAVGSPDSVPLIEAAQPRIGAGRGFRAYPHLEHRLSATLAEVRNDLLPRAQEMARMAAIEIASGRGVSPEEAVPQYLRDEVARIPSRE
jgi:tRNA threonylcarbamoyladenosine biosynthesis protein TsaB